MPPFLGQVAQLVEQRIENPRVGGSIPSLATKILSIEMPDRMIGHFVFVRRPNDFGHW
jgi:hypothetical protein